MYRTLPEDDLWFVAYGQKAIRLLPTKGLAHIRYLLERPHEPVPVTQLVEAAQAGGRGVDQRTGTEDTEAAASELGSIRRTLGDAGPASDFRALTELNIRVNALNAEIREAEDNNDCSEVE